MNNTLRRTLPYLLLVSTLLLSGCAMTRMVESYVSSFIGSGGAVTDVGYRFERLPSQEAHPGKQERVEALASKALEQVGLTRTDNKPRYSVQVTLQVDPATRNPARQLIQNGFYAGADGLLWEAPPTLLLQPPWYVHSVRILLRDLTTGQVAYEATAIHEGPWADTGNLLPPMLEAALRGYPNPPSGPRTIVTELPPEPVKVPQ